MTEFKDVKISKYDRNGIRLFEHEALLVFNNDGGKYAFNEWFLSEGSKIFNEWCLNSDIYKCEASK